MMCLGGELMFGYAQTFSSMLLNPLATFIYISTAIKKAIIPPHLIKTCIYLTKAMAA